MKSKKKILMILIIIIMILFLLFAICSKIYNIFAVPVNVPLGASEMRSDKGAAGTLNISGTQVYCLGHNKNYSATLLGSLKEVQSQSAGQSGIAETEADADAMIAAVLKKQSFSGELARLVEVPARSKCRYGCGGDCSG